MIRYPALALVLLAAGSAHAAEKKLDRTFTVAPGGALIVEADGAAVHVAANDSNQVVVHMVARGSDDELANTTLEAVQKDNGVTVTLRKGKHGWFSWGSWSSEQDIQVTVPSRYNINVHTGGGSVELRDTVGAASLHSSGGDISARNVTGNVELRTSGGAIQAEAIRGDVDADTSGGEVRLLRIDGKIRGNTSGGDMRISLVGANRGISVTTSGGDIELKLPRGTTANIEADTNGGQVSSELPLASTIQKDTHLEGSLNGGGQQIYVHTSGGSISLRAAN